MCILLADVCSIVGFAQLFYTRAMMKLSETMRAAFAFDLWRGFIRLPANAFLAEGLLPRISRCGRGFIQEWGELPLHPLGPSASSLALFVFYPSLKSFMPDLTRRSASATRRHDD